MKPTGNWDKTSAQTGMGERLEAGGHIVQIKGVKIQQSKAGRDMLVLFIDIADGTERDGIFGRKWQNKKSYGGEVKWPNDGTYYQLLTDKDGNTNPRFKGLIQSVENSNGNFHWNWDETALKGCRVGMIFGEEEYIGNDGQIYTTCKPRFVCEADKAIGQPAPQIVKVAQSDTNGFVEVTKEDDDELPF